MIIMDDMNAAKLLEECEKGLRRLVGAAATKGDYAEIVRLTSWAKIIGELAEDANRHRSIPTPPHGSVETYRTFVTPIGQETRQAVKPSKGRAKARSAKPSGYPKFFRRNRELIKIGWSKQERAEYQHKAQHAVLMQLVSKLAVVGAGGKIFTAEDVFPLGAEEGSPIPNYQAYLCLAWLRHEGLVDAHGRQGYALANAEI